MSEVRDGETELVNRLMLESSREEIVRLEAQIKRFEKQIRALLTVIELLGEKDERTRPTEG